MGRVLSRRSGSDADELDGVALDAGLDDEPVEQLTARVGAGLAAAGSAAAAGSVDGPRIEAAVREILVAIGEDPDRDGLRATPSRVARACAELFSGLHADPAAVLSTSFEAEHEEMVIVRDISVASVCEHHLLPFTGRAHIAYIPAEDGRITGLSKLARLVDVYARRPQVQERLTTQVADALVEHLGARGVLVVLDCEHQCMSVRGVRQPSARTTTSAVRGQLRDASTRAEALSLVLGR